MAGAPVARDNPARLLSDLASAQRALAEIVEQGEGTDHDCVWDRDRDMFHPGRDEVAHYFRFHEIAAGCRYAPGRHARVEREPVDRLTI